MAEFSASADRVESSSRAEPRSVGLWDRLAFETVRSTLWLIARLVGLSGLYCFGQAFGTVEWLINYKRRGRFARKMEQVFSGSGASEARGACRRYFVRTRCDKIFYLILDKLSRERLRGLFTIDNETLLDEGLKRGQGAYVALSHSGAHHVAALLMAVTGRQVAGVRDRNEGALMRYTRGKFERTLPEFARIRMFYSGAYPRDIYRCFRENFVLGSALDPQRSRSEHFSTVAVRMFGEERDLLTGTLQNRLAMRGRRLAGLHCFGKELPDYRLELLGPLLTEQTGPETPEALGEIMQTYAHNIERFLRRHPCHVSRL